MYFQRSYRTLINLGVNSASEVFKFSGLKGIKPVKVFVTTTVSIPANYLMSGKYHLIGYYQYPNNLPFGGSREGFFTLANATDIVFQITVEFDPLFMALDIPEIWFVLQCPAYMVPATEDYATLLVGD